MAVFCPLNKGDPRLKPGVTCEKIYELRIRVQEPGF